MILPANLFLAWLRCVITQAAMITGRYPWGAGFYDMSQDMDHCTTNSTALPELLKPLGYKLGYRSCGRNVVRFSLPPSCTHSRPPVLSPSLAAVLPPALLYSHPLVKLLG